MNASNVGQQVAFKMGGQVMFAGQLKYVTPDGWAGIRQADGRLDEAPIEACEVVEAWEADEADEAEWLAELEHKKALVAAAEATGFAEAVRTLATYIGVHHPDAEAAQEASREMWKLAEKL